MRTFPISRMVEEFDPDISVIETAIDCFDLPDGRAAQLTVKLETDGGKWLPVESNVQQMINDRDREVQNDG